MLNLHNVYVNENMLVALPKKEFHMPAGTHTHSAYEFYIPLVQGATHIFGSKSLVLNRKRVVPINPFLEHGLAQEVPRFTTIDIMMDKCFVENLSEAMFGRSQIEFQCAEYRLEPELDHLIRSFINEATNLQAGANLALQSLATLMVIHFFRNFRSNMSGLPQEQNYRENKKMMQVIEFMNEEYYSDFSLDQLASLANLSPYHFIRVFKAFTGKTPYDFMLEIKIEKAKEILKVTSNNMTTIASICGFSNPSHFTTVFKRKTGFSPQQYRKLNPF